MSENIQPENILLLTNQKIKAAVKYLKKKKIILLAGIILGIAFGAFYSTVKRPLYTGTVSFSIEGDDNSSGGGSLLSLAAQFGLDIGGGVGGIFEGENIIELFKSRKMIEETLLLPYDSSQKSFADAFLDVTGWRNNGNYKQNFFPVYRNVFNREHDSVMGEMYNYINKGLLYVDKPDTKLNIYYVTFKSNDEEFTKLFSQALVNEVSSFYITTKTNRASYNVQLLQKRTDSIRNAFDKSLYGRAGILDANLNPAFQTPTVGAEKEQANITVLGTAYGELLKNLELAKYTLLKQIPYIQVIDQPHYPLEVKTYPYWLYVPLSAMGFFCLFAGGLIGLLILRKAYDTYFKG